ncbi:MAG: Pyridine nucleotide-disulfide oxidoreductase [Phycisphaerales bacterium]|nr:Pyridine nucleotide-disulfide oxidoreductase [Phycisphaerales bacterium]
MQTLQTDIAVVGAGPIGLELAAALKRHGFDYLQFDAKQIGYTISWFAPFTRFFSSNERIAIAGVPLHTPDQGKASREQYLDYLRGVVELFDLQVNTYEPVTAIRRDGDGFILTTNPPAGPRVCRARRVVLVTGGTDRPRRLNIPGEDLPNVSHYFQDPHPYFRKRLLIVGGKNSAVEAALRCHHAGAHVSLSYRGTELSAQSIKYWLMPEITGLIESGRIPAYFGTVPTKIAPTEVTLTEGSGFGGQGSGGESGSRVEGVGNKVLTPSPPSSLNPDPRTLNPLPRTIPADFVLLLIGYAQDNKLLRLAGVQLQGDNQGPVFDERTMETNIPGLYVAGTAVGGTQDKYRIFIENCHVHVDRIIAAFIGEKPPAAPEPIARPET